MSRKTNLKVATPQSFQEAEMKMCSVPPVVFCFVFHGNVLFCFSKGIGFAMGFSTKSPAPKEARRNKTRLKAQNGQNPPEKSGNQHQPENGHMHLASAELNMLCFPVGFNKGLAMIFSEISSGFLLCFPQGIYHHMFFFPPGGSNAQKTKTRADWRVMTGPGGSRSPRSIPRPILQGCSKDTSCCIPI